MTSATALPGWRPLAEADLTAVEVLGRLGHPTLPERPEVFAKKRRLFPAGALALSRPDGPLLGYALAHPWVADRVPKLDALLGELPAAPTLLFVHDVVVALTARGGGAAGAVIRHYATLAQELGLGRLALVSVYGTARLWARSGFEVAPIGAGELEAYGTGAVYMAASTSARCG